jgi:hypothetical protein
MTYDEGLGLAVVFAGTEGSARGNNETWVYNSTANNWTRLVTPLAPPSRFAHAMAYDWLTQRHFIFGGGPLSNVMNDTWSLDVVNSTWTKLVPAVSPEARTAAAMASTYSGGEIVLFGGQKLGAKFNDTWLLNTTTGQWTNITTGTSPTGRAGHVLVREPNWNALVLLGGASVTGQYLNDSWWFDPPSRRWSPRPQFDGLPPLVSFGAARGSAFVVVFGGNLGTDLSGETWRWTAAAGWSREHDTIAPSARFGHGLTHDPVTDRYVLHGGSNAGGISGETWLFDNSTKNWTNARPSPTAGTRINPGMVYLPSIRRHLLFAGVGGDNETWLYDAVNNTWSAHNLNPAPKHRTGIPLAYDPVRDAVLLFSGSGCTGLCNDTWAFYPRLMKWQEIAPPASPPPRALHSMAYDPLVRKVVMFGGTTGSGQNAFGDTWLFDFANRTWQEIAPPVPPPARCCSSLVFDAASQGVLLFGGSGPFGISRDLWQLSAAADWWYEVRAPDPPPQTMSHAAAIDAARGTMLVFGGIAGKIGEGFWGGETWLFWGGSPAPLPPKIVSTSPPADAVEVSPLSKIVVEFDQDMNSTATVSAFLISPPVAGGKANSTGRYLTFSHLSPLQEDMLYTVLVTTKAKSQAGVALLETHVFGFTTGKLRVPRPPTIIATEPADGESGVPAPASVRVTFDQIMDPVLTKNSFRIEPSPGAGTLSLSGADLGWSSTAGFAAGREYIVTITTQATSAEGDRMPAPHTIRFTTAPAPIVVETSPRGNATHVPLDQKLFVKFSERMDPGSVGGAFSSTPEIAWNLSWDLAVRELTAAPERALEPGARYTIFIDGSAKSAAGFGLGAEFILAFDTVPPEGNGIEQARDYLWALLVPLAVIGAIVLMVALWRRRRPPTRPEPRGEREPGEVPGERPDLPSVRAEAEAPPPPAYSAPRRPEPSTDQESRASAARRAAMRRR